VRDAFITLAPRSCRSLDAPTAVMVPMAGTVRLLDGHIASDTAADGTPGARAAERGDAAMTLAPGVTDCPGVTR
jgi:hypothetical protein